MAIRTDCAAPSAGSTSTATKITVSSDDDAAKNATFAIRTFRWSRSVGPLWGGQLSAPSREKVTVGKAFFVRGTQDLAEALAAIPGVPVNMDYAVYQPVAPAEDSSDRGARFQRRFKLHRHTFRDRLPRSWVQRSPAYDDCPGFTATFGVRPGAPKRPQPKACEPEVREIPVQPVVVRRYDVCTGKVISERQIYEPVERP